MATMTLKAEFQIQTVVIVICNKSHQVPSCIIPHLNQVFNVPTVPSDGSNTGVSAREEKFLLPPSNVKVHQRR